MLRPLILVLLAGMTPVAHALGLGRLAVSSGLDEPLNGRIELISPTPQEIKTLKVSLASREEFEIAGIERAALLFELKYDVVQEANGRYSIHVTTLQPVREPFLHFLIRVEWSGGRLVREYSTLLDPPQWAVGAPAEIDVPPVVPVSPEAVVAEKKEAQSADQLPLEELPPIAEDGLGTPATPSAADTAKEAPASEATASEESRLESDNNPTPSQPTAEPSVSPVPAVAAGGKPAVPEKPTEPVMPEKASPETVATSAPEPTVEETPTSLNAEVQPDEKKTRVAAPDLEPTKEAKVAAREFGPVIRGDTLTQIAAKLNYDRGVTSQQVLIALLRANPSAFHQKNINILYAGKILKVPERDTVAAISVQEAGHEVRAQYDAWQEYKLKLAGASRLMPAAPSERPGAAIGAAKPIEKKKAEKKTATAKPDQTKPEKSGQVVAKDSSKAEPIDLLKIVRASLEHDIADDAAKTPGVETSNEGSKEKAKLSDKVATLEESIESKQIQNKELRERVGKLQEQNKNAERLIDIENKELAKTQKQAAEKQAADEKALAEAASKVKQEADAREKAAVDARKKEQEKIAAQKPVETVKSAETKQQMSPATPQAEENILDSILAGMAGFAGNTFALAILGGIGAIAASLGGFYYLRRRRAARGFTESILSGSSLTGESGISGITDTTNPQPSTDTSFLSDFSQGGTGHVHHADEVDPIAEAEVYLAYGRDEQAEEILRDAITKDPTRQEVRGKLLEIYFQRNDVAAFETVAEELYASLEGKGGKVWEKVEEMGRKLSPGNPMFSGGMSMPRAQVSSTAPTAIASAAPTTMLMPESGLTHGSPAAASLEFEVPSSSPAPAAETSSGLDFSLNFDSPPAEKPVSSLDMSLDFDAGASSDAGKKDSGLDMDFSLSDTAAGSDTSSNSIDFSMTPTTESAAGGLDFSMPAAEPISDGLDFSLASTAESSSDDLDLSRFESTATGNSAGGTDTNVIDFSTAALGDDTALEFESAATVEAQDAGDTSGAGLPGWDETATKLDLAKAYIDMGDAEGARSILDEVMAEGNESQKKQARDLASQIAA